MKTDKETEQMLLNNTEYNKLVKLRIEQEFNGKIQNPDTSKSRYINNIKEVPKDKLFTVKSVFEVINKNSRTKSYINGIQAEGYIGSNNFVRNTLLKGEEDSFVIDDVYVKFLKCKV